MNEMIELMREYCLISYLMDSSSKKGTGIGYDVRTDICMRYLELKSLLRGEDVLDD